MKRKTTVELISSSDVASLYSISFEKDGTTEFEKFVDAFERNAIYRKDYGRILAALQIILEKGALERFFRPEGGIGDSVAALPLEGGKLRLYCLRISEQILVIGNGGVKTGRRYEDDKLLLGYVIDLRHFELLLNRLLESGVVRIIKKNLEGIEDQVLEI